jgi:predicted RNA-binding protein Jag
MPYDATAEPNEFVGDTREEAISKAASFYGVSEDELKIGEPSEVFGLGARVVVVAVPKDLGGRRPPGGGGGGDRGGRDRGGRGRDRDRGGRGDRGGRDRDRGGRGRGEGRGGRERGDRNEVRASRDEGPRAERDEPAEPSAGPVPSKGTASGAISSIGEYVLGAVELMRLGNFDLTETEEDDFLVLQLEGPAADRLGADDRAVGALQLLANQAAMRADEDPKRVVLDCEGDADQRDSLLERTADRAARRAKDTGRSVALDPMNGRDRRALHMAVREIDDVVTMSVGSGRYRQVVIVPEGAPEYEEAAAAAHEAENRDS